MPQPDFDLRALYAALDEQRRSRDLSWASVAREVNGDRTGLPGPRAVAVSTITGLRTKAFVEGDGVLQMLLWLGRTPESFVPGAESAGAALSRVEPSKILRWDTPAIYAALDAKRTAESLTWSEAANRVGGVTAAGLTRLAKGGRIAFPQVMRIVRWLGKPAATFTRASSW